MTKTPTTISAFQSPRIDGGEGVYLGYLCRSCEQLHVYPQRGRLMVNDVVRAQSLCAAESGSPNCGVAVVLRACGKVRGVHQLDHRTQWAKQNGSLYKNLDALSGDIERIVLKNTTELMTVAAMSASSVVDIAYCMVDAFVPNMHHISLEFSELIGAWYARGCPGRRSPAGGTSGTSKLGCLGDPVAIVDDLLSLLREALLPEQLRQKATDGRALTELLKIHYDLTHGITALRLFEAVGGVSLDIEAAGQFSGIIDGYDSFQSGWKPWSPNSHPSSAFPRRPVKPMRALDEILVDDFEDGDDKVPS